MTAPSTVNKAVIMGISHPKQRSKCAVQAVQSCEDRVKVFLVSRTRYHVAALGLAALATLGGVVVRGLAQRDVCSGADRGLGTVTSIKGLAGNDAVNF